MSAANVFDAKCALVFKTYLDELHPGFLDHYEGQLVDAILTWWPEPTISLEKARLVVEKWLKPTLESMDTRSKEVMPVESQRPHESRPEICP